ncbi:MAG: hypothetical protein FWE22_05980 [Firmicutes bacterium]|nr:hypothetical protein [Bacillota bacterium]
MKKQIFRFILVGILAFAFIMPMLGCGSRDYEFQEEDFSLEITASQTTASVGDTIEITAIFKNLSGQNIRIQFTCNDFRTIEEKITIVFFPEYRNIRVGFCLVEYRFPRRRTLRRGDVIERTREFVVETHADYEAWAIIGFYIGRGFNELVSIRSNKIIINII